jgi:hypothetical protein
MTFRADVSGHGERLTVESVSDRAGKVAVDVDHHDVSAVVREAPSRRGSDAAARPRDDYDGAVESPIAHRCLRFSSAMEASGRRGGGAPPAVGGGSGALYRAALGGQSLATSRATARLGC